MRCKEFHEDDRDTTANVKMKILKMLGEYGITDQTLKNCEFVFATDNGSRNTGEEGIKTTVSRIICTDHRSSTVLVNVLNKKQQSIYGWPKS
eukprot:12642058-Ditylum_brightwellii.AAC.1